MGREPVTLPVPRWVWVGIGLGGVLALGCLVMAWVMSQREAWVQRFERRGQLVEREALLPVERAVVPIYAGPTEVLVEEGIVSEISGSLPLVVSATLAPTVTRWQANAGAAVVVPEGFGRLAIVIDDMGVERGLSARALAELPPAVTLAFLPYGAATRELALRARERGHEILVHLPMEPLVHVVSGSAVMMEMGPKGLRVEMGQDEIGRLVRENVAGLLDVAVGANNHMGSKFTQFGDGMQVVLAELAREGMLFLDSRTVAKTAVRQAAEGLELPLLGRDVFLDHVGEAAAIRSELRKAIGLAKKRGFAVAIGHPLPVTLDVLREELRGIEAAGVVLVPLTAGVR